MAQDSQTKAWFRSQIQTFCGFQTYPAHWLALSNNLIRPYHPTKEERGAAVTYFDLYGHCWMKVEFMLC